MLLVAQVAHASVDPGDEQHEGVAEVMAIRFVGNSSFSVAELSEQLSMRETPGFLKKFLYKSISEKLGRKDEFLNTITVGADINRIKKFYANRGFLEAAVDTLLAFGDDGKKVDITFRIGEGRRSIVDSLAYRGIPDFPETIWQDVRSAPRIVQGDPYNSVVLEDEIRRVLRVLSDNGFPNAAFERPPNSKTEHFASTGNCLVVLSFKPGKRYRFGTITVEQEVDSARGIERRPDITADILLRHLDYKPGDFYSIDARVNSERNLNRLGILDLRRIDLMIPPLTDTSIMVPSTVVIRPRDRHEFAPELVVSNENEAFNLGTGLGYTSRNFFGGGRILSAHLRFRTQTLGAFPNYFARNSSAVSNVDATFELLQPYLFTNKMKGTWSFSYIIDKQKPYKLNIIRNKFGINNRFAEFTTGQLDWTLESINNRVRDSSDQVDQEQLRQLLLLPKKQFNSVLSFTLQRDQTNDVFSPSDGFVHSVTIQESGLLPLALGWVEKKLYTQFYSASTLLRWYIDASDGKRFSVLGLKLKAAVEEKYGESRSDTARQIPQTNRYFAGGSGSIRGWGARELIAGGGEPQLGGDLLLEGSVELRLNPLQALHDGVLDKFWLVEFVDVGNLWPSPGDFKLRDVAIAAGIGIRYDTFFGPFRIDWGFRVYDPGEPDGRNWITQKKLFGQTFKEGVFHFGIGHAF